MRCQMPNWPKRPQLGSWLPVTGGAEEEEELEESDTSSQARRMRQRLHEAQQNNGRKKSAIGSVKIEPFYEGRGEKYNNNELLHHDMPPPQHFM